MRAEAQAPATLRKLDRPGRTTAIRGGAALAYGALFVIAGIAAAWFVWQMHRTANAQDVSGLRLSFLGLFVGIFLLSGLYFCAHGVGDILAEGRKRRLAIEEPEKPWLGDFAWKPEGCKFSALLQTSKLVTTAMIGTAIVAPLIWVVLGNPFAWAFDLFVGMLALIPAYAWWRWLGMAIETLRFGRSFLSFDAFPFFLGGELRARIEVKRSQSSIQSLSVTLRCVQEKYVSMGGSRRWGGNTRGITSTESYELFKKVVAVDGAQIAVLDGDGISVRFSIPADQPPSQLSNRPPIYWEVEAVGEAEGAAYKAMFLVPVYAAPRS